MECPQFFFIDFLLLHPLKRSPTVFVDYAAALLPPSPMLSLTVLVTVLPLRVSLVELQSPLRTFRRQRTLTSALCTTPFPLLVLIAHPTLFNGAHRLRHEQTTSADKDYRYMALNDLHGM